jgi:hypothetical protein
MGARYLCSRTELFRRIDLDIGNRPLFIGAPNSFLEWLEKMLPGNSVSVDNVCSIPESSSFDRIVIWSKIIEELGSSGMDTLNAHSRDNATIWIVYPMGEELPGKGIFTDTGNGSLPISTEWQISRVDLAVD